MSVQVNRKSVAVCSMVQASTVSHQTFHPQNLHAWSSHAHHADHGYFVNIQLQI